MYNKIWNKDFILLIMSNFLMYITYYAIISVLPVYLVTELGASKGQVGFVVGAYTLASVLIRPFSGFALDRFNRKMIFLTALFLYTVFFAGYLIAITIASLILLRFLQGLTWGFTTVSGSTIAVDLIPEANRGQGLGYFAMSTTMGMSVGPVVGVFIANQFGHVAMFVSGIIITAASLVCAYKIGLPHRVNNKPVRFSWDRLFDKKSLLSSANVFIMMIPYGGILSFIALYGKEIGVHNSSLFFLIFAAAIAISRFTSGKEFDRNGPRKILTLCILLLIVGFPFLAGVTTAWEYYLSAVIIGFGNGVVWPTFQSMVNNVADAEQRGAANSTLYTAVDLGMGLGMVMAGQIAQQISISAIFITSGFICAAGLIFFRLFVLKSYEKSVS